MLKKVGRDRRLTVGADPEFEVLNKYDEVVRASDIISDCYLERAIGCDGHDSTGELRPSYAYSPKGLTERIRYLIMHFHEQHPGYTMRAGAGVCEPLGGHIHFNIVLRPPQISALDAMVAVSYNRLCNMELRRGMGYGQLSEWRDQDHGSEYRSPSSWLCDPVIAEALLSMAWCCVLYAPRINKWLGGRDSPSYTHIIEFALESLPKRHAKAIVQGYNRMRDMFAHQEVAEDVNVLAAWSKDMPKPRGKKKGSVCAV